MTDRDFPVKNENRTSAGDSRERRRIIVQGRVQGVGFRPTVYRYARKSELAGFVRNDSRGVVVELEGKSEKIENFLADLQRQPPHQARIDSLIENRIPCKNQSEFSILASDGGQEMAVGMPPDLAVCDDCLAELSDPRDRRCRYPFLNCTNCGPRFSIIRELPYDRDKTSMHEFTMCHECAQEYNNPVDRRFDAQPNACPECGPSLALRNSEGIMEVSDPLGKTADLLKGGALIAIKGLGGFHLACQALDQKTIGKLRERKQRPSKPLAVMFKDMEEVKKYCRIKEADEADLLSSARPIVVLKRRCSKSGLPAAVSPDTDDVGAFLPYTPLHHLLLAQISPLIMTSANLRDEPIAMNKEEVDELLGVVVDYVLDHNREIIRRCDDSLVRNGRKQRFILRRSRGFVPDPVDLPFSAPPVMACGGDLKNAFCITRDKQAFLSQHIGDLKEARALSFYERQIADFQELLQVSPEFIACDLHPDYHSTEYAFKQAAREKSKRGRHVISVQHHHAHIAACLAENGVTHPVIGIALDGTGYGDDATIWGGEFLIADLDNSRRAGCFRQFPLLGGEAAVRQPVRTAFSLLHQAGFDIVRDYLPPALEKVACGDRELFRQMFKQGLNSPFTSSAGRLFDGVSALLGLCPEDEISYEAQAAIRLESIADEGVRGGYRYSISDAGEIDFAFMTADIVADLRSGINPSRIAGLFHNTLTDAVVEMCCRIRRSEGVHCVAMSGGVFQNVLLSEMIKSSLVQHGFETLTHHRVPANDGGLALGQAAVAASRHGVERNI